VQTINMHEAKTHLSKLVEAAAKGESFIIAKAGKPMVKVIAVESESPEVPRKSMKRIGFAAGEIVVPEDSHSSAPTRSMSPISPRSTKTHSTGCS